jgi:hypothetical protein
MVVFAFQSLYPGNDRAKDVCNSLEQLVDNAVRRTVRTRILERS